MEIILKPCYDSYQNDSENDLTLSCRVDYGGNPVLVLELPPSRELGPRTLFLNYDQIKRAIEALR